VRLSSSSQLQDILGCRHTRVNSFHHQAVDVLGSRLLATSHAADGTIESLEADDRPFVVGVQWHAECLIGQARQLALFRALVNAARQFSERRDRQQAA
jgi:putative glutamine amidotransferase